MKIKIVFEQDSESACTDWQGLEKKIANWVQNFPLTSQAFSLADRNRTITLDFKGNDILSAVRDLHNKLYNSQVNFTLSFF